MIADEFTSAMYHMCPNISNFKNGRICLCCFIIRTIHYQSLLLLLLFIEFVTLHIFSPTLELCY